MTNNKNGLSQGVDIWKIAIYLTKKATIASRYSKTDRVKKTQKMGAGRYIRKPYTLEKNTPCGCIGYCLVATIMEKVLLPDRFLRSDIGVPDSEVPVIREYYHEI